MSRILKRPMFRMGGTPNQGIMHGLVDRKGYKQGTTWEETLEKYPNIAEAYGAIGGIDQPRDTSMYEMLIGGGLNLVSGAGAGEGLMSNVAKSYKGPSEAYFEAQRARKAYDSEMKRTAAQAGLQQKWKMDQIAAQKAEEKSPLYNVYLEQGVELGMSGAEAERFAAYHTGIQDELRKKVGDNRVGGVIEVNLNSLTNKQQREFANKNKNKIGRYFYDPFDGKIKKLVEQDGQLGWIPFDSVESIDLTATGTEGSTISTSPYADEQAAIAQEKSEGLLTDEDIAGIRFP